MKEEVKWHSKHWRTVRLLTFITGVVLLVVFFQSWRVYAFDAGQAVAHTAVAVGSPAPATSSPGAPKTHEISVVPTKAERLSQSDAISALSDFYQSIITCIGLMLGVVGVLSVTTLRFLSKAAAEDIAHDSAKEAMRHYLETRKFNEAVDYAVQETDISKLLEKLAIETSTITKRLDQFAAELEQVKRQTRGQTAQASAPTASNDHDDDEHVEGVVDPSVVPPVANLGVPPVDGAEAGELRADQSRDGGGE
jgi:hypothetical protein